MRVHLLRLALTAVCAAVTPAAVLAQPAPAGSATEATGQEARPAAQAFDKVFSVCQNVVPVGHPDFALANEIASGQDALLTGPKHGRLVLTPKGVYFYYPDAGYLGVDQMTFVVSYTNPASGKKIREKVIYSAHIGTMAPEYGPSRDDTVKELPNLENGGR